MTNLELMIYSLEELASDREFQLAHWTGKISGEQASFTEAVCGLFDDAWLGRMLDNGELDRIYSPALCLKARQLSTLTDKIVANLGTPEQILDHPLMDSLRETAGELLALLISESKYQAPEAPPSSALT